MVDRTDSKTSKGGEGLQLTRKPVVRLTDLSTVIRIKSEGPMKVCKTIPWFEKYEMEIGISIYVFFGR